MSPEPLFETRSELGSELSYRSNNLIKAFFGKELLNELKLLGFATILMCLLTGCFIDTITEFENCVPEVTLVSTEATPPIEIIRGDSAWSDFKLSNNDYDVCISGSTSFPCGSGRFSFTTLPVGTVIKLDGFAAEHDKLVVSKSLYLRGHVDNIRVWVSHFDLKNLDDPINRETLNALGVLDENGDDVSYPNWQCP